MRTAFIYGASLVAGAIVVAGIWWPSILWSFLAIGPLILLGVLTDA